MEAVQLLHMQVAVMVVLGATLAHHLAKWSLLAKPQRPMKAMLLM
jgi:hypothetical protein